MTKKEYSNIMDLLNLFLEQLSEIQDSINLAKLDLNVYMKKGQTIQKKGVKSKP